LYLHPHRTARGLAEGTARGLARGKAEALLIVLEARGLSLDDDANAQIRTCSETELLDRWIRRAVTAESVADVLDA